MVDGDDGYDNGVRMINKIWSWNCGSKHKQVLELLEGLLCHEWFDSDDNHDHYHDNDHDNDHDNEEEEEDC